MSADDNALRPGPYTRARPCFIEQRLRLRMNYASVFMLGHYSDEAAAATGAAQLIGAKRLHRVEYVIANGPVVAFIIGVAPFIPITGGSSVIIALYSSMLPILRTHGYVRQAMVVPITVSVINVILNALFLYGPLAYLNRGVTCQQHCQHYRCGAVHAWRNHY